jgi:Amt family ammonium transporter
MLKRVKWLRLAVFSTAAIICAGLAGRIWAADGPTDPNAALKADVESLKGAVNTANIAIDTAWVLMTAALVFFMQAGFGMVEAGFIRAKHTTNILMKNTLDFCTASVAFLLVGYAIMFGPGNAYVGTEGWGMMWGGRPETKVTWEVEVEKDGKKVPEKQEATVKMDAGTIPVPNGVGVPTWAFWMFQVAFAGAAATIVAGGMAERTKFVGYLLYTIVVSAIIYPVVGHWIWYAGHNYPGTGAELSEPGWLNKMGFLDFAGSTVVHSVGGLAALAGTIVLGPRLGKYGPKGEMRPILGHNLTVASLGLFILWFGWFGFNPGSTLSLTGAGMSELAGRIFVTTNIAAAAGAITAMAVSWGLHGKADFGMTVNGALAGLVAITAPCAFVTPIASIWIGVVGGVLVVFATKFLDTVGIDDPVGAVPVHCVNGIWGTLSVGLFHYYNVLDDKAPKGLLYGGGVDQTIIQLIGIGANAAWTLGVAFVLFYAIKFTVGLRVSEQEEYEGLDLAEHAAETYPEFQMRPSN